MGHVNRKRTETGHDGLVEELLTHLRTLPQSKWTKIVGGPMQEAGLPDIFGCLRGHTVVLEAKLPGEFPRPLQAIQLREYTEAGAYVGCVHSLEECQAIIAQVPPEVIRISYLGTDESEW